MIDINKAHLQESSMSKTNEVLIQLLAEDVVITIDEIENNLDYTKEDILYSMYGIKKLIKQIHNNMFYGDDDGTRDK